MTPSGRAVAASALANCWLGPCPVSLAASGPPITAASTSRTSRQNAKIETGSCRSRRKAVARVVFRAEDGRDGDRADPVLGLRDRRQARIGVGGELNVVDADHRQVIG